MTRFDADLHRLATQLAAMAAAPAITTAADDTALVNRARLILRNCCRTMLDDLQPSHPDAVDAPPGLADLALNPVGVLGRLLRQDPPPLALNPTTRSGHLIEQANQYWDRLANAAEVVTHEWTSADPASHPAGEQAWTRIADVAALTQASAALDRHLVEADTAPVKVLRPSVALELAAEYARRHATNGPLPHPLPLQPKAHRQSPMIIRSVADLPGGLTQLAVLVKTAGHLRPDTIAALATAHARTLDTLGETLTATSPPAQRARRRRFAAALNAHGQSLSTVRAACRTLKSVEPDDTRSADQMREIRTAMRPLADRPDQAADTTVQKALLASLRPALTVTLAIDTAANSHIGSGRWYMPTDGQLIRWAKISRDHPINDALELAAAHARSLVSQLPPPHPSSPRYRVPHEILTPAVLDDRACRGEITPPPGL